MFPTDIQSLTPPPTERLPVRALTPITALHSAAQLPPAKRRAPPAPLDLEFELAGTGHPLDPYHVRGVAPRDQPASYRVLEPAHRPILMGINKTKFEREEEYAADPSKLELHPVNACRTCMAKGYRCFVEADPTVRERWRCWMCTHACSVAAGRMHLFGSTRGRKNNKRTPIRPNAPKRISGPRSALAEPSPYALPSAVSTRTPGRSHSFSSVSTTPTPPPSNGSMWTCASTSSTVSGRALSPSHAHRVKLSASQAAMDALSSRLERQLSSLASARAEAAQFGAAADALGMGQPLTPASELARGLNALGITPCRQYFADGSAAPSPSPAGRKFWQ